MDEKPIEDNGTLRLLSFIYHSAFFIFYLLLGWSLIAAIQSFFSESGIEMLVPLLIVPISIVPLALAIVTRILYKKYRMKLILKHS